LADTLGLAVELIATWRRVTPRRSIDLEAVAPKAGDDVQVRMQDFLAGGFAVGDEEIDPIRADDVAVAKGARELAGHSEQAIRVCVGQIVREHHVFVRYHEQVAGSDRSDIKEGAHQLVTEDEARVRPARDDVAEDALTHHAASAANRPGVPAGRQIGVEAPTDRLLGGSVCPSGTDCGHGPRRGVLRRRFAG
jgi:hypothetical protein